MMFNDTSLPPVSLEDAAPLRAAVAGSVLLPGDAGYDVERAVWNLNHELVPAIIVVPESAADVQAAVTFAAKHHRPVLVKTTGHQVVGKAHGAVVIATHRLNDITIDATARTARVGAGVVWSEVIEQTAKVGLAPLNGSNPHVGVSGYTLGGGLSPTLGRSQGYAADHVRSLDVVTARGEVRHVNARSEPDLFWALRGGKGNFAVVITLEFNLFPVSRLYGGAIYFPGERTADVLRAWADWHPSTPESMVTSIAVMRMPSMTGVPLPVRGKFLVSVRIAYNGTKADGERMLKALRAVAPAVLDSVRDMPYAEVASIHSEPTEPVPYYERGIMLREFPAQAQAKLIGLVGPNAKTDLVMVELRALGGMWDREPAVPNSVATRGLPYSLLAVSAGPLSQEQQLKQSVADVLEGMKPWQADRRFVNNLAPDEATEAAAIYGPERYQRLASIKKTYDPSNMFRLNHNVKPASD
jgi:FAD/FMN-containing dehydrogenase